MYIITNLPASKNWLVEQIFWGTDPLGAPEATSPVDDYDFSWNNTLIISWKQSIASTTKSRNKRPEHRAWVRILLQAGNFQEMSYKKVAKRVIER